MNTSWKCEIRLQSAHWNAVQDSFIGHVDAKSADVHNLKHSFYRRIFLTNFHSIFEHSYVSGAEVAESVLRLGYGLDYRGSIPRTGNNEIFPPPHPHSLGPTQPLIQWVPGFLTPRVKTPGREFNHSLSSSAEVKNAWSCTSTSLICVHGVVLN